jgi:hypothetical protein
MSRSCFPSIRRGALRVAAVACLVAVSFFATACAGGGSSSVDGGDGIESLERPSVGTVEPGEPVNGEVAVSWVNLRAESMAVRMTLVSASSEAGQMLRSGRATSTEVRVLSDADMGTLLGELEDRGFYEHSTRGIGLENIPNVPGRRGIVVVHDNGKDYGLMLVPGGGATPLPASYRDCKALVLAVHGQIQGLEVRINADADRVFSAPPIRMPRR